MHLDPYRFRSSVVILHHVLFSFPFWANCMRGNEKKMCIIEIPCPIARRRPGGPEERRKRWIKIIWLVLTLQQSPHQKDTWPQQNPKPGNHGPVRWRYIYIYTQLLVLKPQDQGLNLACNSCVTIFLYSSTSPINLVTLPSAQTQS